MRTTENLVRLPISQLKPSKRYNVRKQKHTAHDIAVLADAIHAEGQGNPLDAVVEVKWEGKGEARAEVETGMYEIAAGQGRLAAMQLLIKDGRWAADADALCYIIPAESARMISYSENTARTQMHPADEYEAFKALIAEGRTIEDIAARFHVSETVVRQRLKLAAVAKEFLTAYRAGEMDLSVLMALTLTDDHAEQRAVISSLRYVNAHSVRERLTQGEVTQNHRLVRFVGHAGYVKAGGAVRSTLFGDELFYDRKLLTELMTAKLRKAEQKHLDNGAAWVDLIDEPTHHPIANHVALRKKPSANERELAGVVLHVDYNGKLETFTDMLRAKDAKRLEKGKATKKASVDANGSPAELSDSMSLRLSLHRTFALQAELASRPDVALAAMVAEMAKDIFSIDGVGYTACGVSLKGEAVNLDRSEDDFTNAASVTHLKDMHERWQALLATKPEGQPFVSWLLEQPHATLLDLLAFCVARRTSAIVYTASGTAASDTLAKAVGLDMHKWWQATAASFFGALPKDTIAAYLNELTGERVDAEKRKKAELAAQAEQVVAEQGNIWLPQPLRTA